MATNEGYLSDTVGREAQRQIFDARLPILSLELPWFDRGVVVPGQTVDVHQTWDLAGRQQPKHRLPSVFVAPVIFWDRYWGRQWMAAFPFRPYWSGPIRVQDMGDAPPDRNCWREASVFKVLCAVAQHPHLGSLRCGDPEWRQSSAQAYYMPERGGVVLDCGHSDAYHNRAYVRRGIGDREPYKALREVYLN